MLARFRKNLYRLPTNREGPVQQKKRHAPNLRDENLRTFHSKADKCRRAEQLPRTNAWGCVSNFIYRVSQDLHLGTG